MDTLYILAVHVAERPTILIAVALVVLLSGLLQLSSRGKQPPYLKEKIPYVTNTIQYLTDVGTFLNRVTTTLEETKSNIVKFHVGPIPAYIVTGTKNVQTVFGSPNILDGNFLQLMLMERHWGMSKEEIAMFANDKSGRLKTPAPGTENTPAEKRFWRGHDHLYAEYLSNRTYADALADPFYRLFSESLNQQSTTEWDTVNLFEMLKTSMAKSAIISLFGSRIIDLNPGFIDCY